MGIRSKLASLLGGADNTPKPTGPLRVDALGTVVSLDPRAAKIAMFLGVPPELAGDAGGALMGADAAASFYRQRVAGALWAEVEEIRAHDPAFDVRRFAEEATTAFLRMQRAFADQDAAAARRVLATPLWEQARFQIEEYRRNGRRNIQENLQIQSVRFLGSHSRNGWDTVGLRFFTATVDYDIDVATNAVVRGDKALHPVAVDVMFERSSSAVTVPEGGTLRERCPHCGAPLTLETSGSCRYCKADVMGGNFDWIMSKIIQLADWDQALASCPPDILQK